MHTKYIFSPLVLILSFLFLFATNSQSDEWVLTTECKVKVADADRGMLHGKGFLYGAPNNKAKIVVKWKSGSVLNFTGTSNGDRAKGTWKNGNNTGTMSIERTSHTTFEGPLEWQNNVNSIKFYNCRTVNNPSVDGGGGENEDSSLPTYGVFFHNTGNVNLTVLVNQTYAVAPPNPSPSTVVFTGPPTSTRNSAAGMSLAYGCYTFCVYWDTGKTNGLNQKIYSYRYIGDLAKNEFPLCHNENTPKKPIVKVSSGRPDGTGVGYEGQCPGVRHSGNPNAQPDYPNTPAQPQGQTSSGSYLPPCDCTNPRNGRRFLLPTLITGACTDETVLDYLRPENYNCR